MTNFYPGYTIRASALTMRGVTGHPTPVQGINGILVSAHRNKAFHRDFVAIDPGHSILGLTVLKSLHIHLLLLVDSK